MQPRLFDEEQRVTGSTPTTLRRGNQLKVPGLFIGTRGDGGGAGVGTNGSGCGCVNKPGILYVNMDFGFHRDPIKH